MLEKKGLWASVSLQTILRTCIIQYHIYIFKHWKDTIKVMSCGNADLYEVAAIYMAFYPNGRMYKECVTLSRDILLHVKYHPCKRSPIWIHVQLWVACFTLDLLDIRLVAIIGTTILIPSHSCQVTVIHLKIRYPYKHPIFKMQWVEQDDKAPSY